MRLADLEETPAPSTNRLAYATEQINKGLELEKRQKIHSALEIYLEAGQTLISELNTGGHNSDLNQMIAQNIETCLSRVEFLSNMIKNLPSANEPTE